MSFVERSIILCPFVGGSTIGGSTVYLGSLYCNMYVWSCDSCAKKICPLCERRLIKVHSI